MTHNTAIVLLLGAILAGGCGRHYSSAAMVPSEPPAPGTRPTSATSPSGRLSLDEAAAAIRREIFRGNPNMNPSADFPAKETTTPDIWDRLRAQVFVVTDGILMYQSYILHEGRASPLGSSFGGWGVTSMCVTDLDGNGIPELLFAHSWGSGRHRSELGLWTAAPDCQSAETALGDYDLSLEKIDDQHVQVFYGDFTPYKGTLARKGRLGQVRQRTDGTSAQLEVVLDENLPGDIRQRLWPTR